jgi:hypothetical protein
MVWAFALAGALGFALGLRFRIAAVIAASPLALVGGALTAVLVGSSLSTVVVASFGIMATLQAGYLASLLLGCALSRVAGWLRRDGQQQDLGSAHVARKAGRRVLQAVF